MEKLQLQIRELEGTRDKLRETHMKNVSDKEELSPKKVQTPFKNERKRRMRGDGPTVDEKMEELHRAFGEELSAYMSKAKQHMKDYITKTSAESADLNPEETPIRRIVTS